MGNQVQEQQIIALRHLRVLLLPAGFLLHLLLPLPQLVNHGVEGIGKFPQEGNVLGVVPLCHLLCLPGQVLEVSADVLQILA